MTNPGSRFEEMLPRAIERLQEVAAGDGSYAKQGRKLLKKYGLPPSTHDPADPAQASTFPRGAP